MHVPTSKKSSDRLEHDSCDESESNGGPYWAPRHSDPCISFCTRGRRWSASRESAAAPRDFSSPQSSWQPFPGASAPRRKPAEPPVDTPVDVESLGAPAPSTPGVHEFIHSVQFGIMPKRPDLPHPDDEILWVMKRMSYPYNQHWNATWSVKAVPSPSIVNPKTGGTLHPFQSIALTTTCFIACVSRRASAF